MKVKVRTIPGSQVGELEDKINEVLSAPTSAGYALAAAFPSPDGMNIVLIFQKP